VWGLDPIVEMRHVTDRVSLAKMGNEVKRSVAHTTLPLPKSGLAAPPDSWSPPTSRAAPATRRERASGATQPRGRFVRIRIRGR
jgi:hypothetical protein